MLETNDLEITFILLEEIDTLKILLHVFKSQVCFIFGNNYMPFSVLCPSVSCVCVFSI